MKTIYIALGLALAFGVAALAGGDEKPELKSPVGKQIAEFKLDDYLGSAHSSSEWKDKKALVVVFLGTECPLAKLYGQRLAELDKKYSDKGIQFVGINSNQQDSLTDIAHYAKIHKIDFPLLKDPGNKIADQFGAERTPEAFLLDPASKVRYWGAIDDQYTVGVSRPKPQQEFLVKAIDQLLAGEQVTTTKTPAAGCYIGRVSDKKPTGEITYSRHIAGIL